MRESVKIDGNRSEPLIVLRAESRSTLIFDREFSRGSKFFHPIIESVHVNTQDLKKLIPESGGILRRSLKFGISYKQRLSRSFYLPMLYNRSKFLISYQMNNFVFDCV